MDERAQKVFLDIVEDRNTPSRVLVAICWRIAHVLNQKNTDRTESGAPLLLRQGHSPQIAKCVFQQNYSDDQVEAARTFILQNWKCRPFQDLLKVDYEYMLTKPLGAGGKKGLACAICVACDSSSKCTSMLQKQDGAMQASEGQVGSHERKKEHQTNAANLRASLKTEYVVQAVGGTGKRKRRNIRDLMGVLGEGWTVVWKGDLQRAYEMGYRDGKEGKQRRRFV
eukprot:COSAG01_NODE_206_length_22034_cov_125.512585_5_plen_225_part_00